MLASGQRDGEPLLAAGPLAIGETVAANLQLVRGCSLNELKLQSGYPALSDTQLQRVTRIEANLRAVAVAVAAVANGIDNGHTVLRTHQVFRLGRSDRAAIAGVEEAVAELDGAIGRSDIIARFV